MLYSSKWYCRRGPRTAWHSGSPRIGLRSVLEPGRSGRRSSSSLTRSYAVQYFYEPFLAAYDPVLRKELGVWYTPPEIVKYMVARVDVVLRSELSIPDRLADPRAYVLDPCRGTGAYLVAVVRRIHQTLSQGGADALVGDDLKHAAMERVFGFEILPAPVRRGPSPRMGLLLQDLGAAWTTPETSALEST